MELQPKALYNLLRMNAEQDPDLKLQPWKVVDYRKASEEELFAALAALGFALDRERFLEIAEQVDTPEQMTGFFAEAMEPEEEDRVYLLIFELWRQFVPDRPSLSIFCDELDHHIRDFDRGEVMQDLIASLQEILDDSADAGTDPQEVFAEVSAHFANDLKDFLYDYIAQEIDEENDGYAAELLEGLSPYVKDARWFDFLQVRIWAKHDLEDSMRGLGVILEDLEENPDPNLDFEILDFLTQTGDHDLFLEVAKRTLSYLTTEEEFAEFLDLCVHYYRCLDREDKEAAIDRLISSRKTVSSDAPLSKEDPGVISVLQIMQSEAGES